jgi:predicted transcriptional regulator
MVTTMSIKPTDRKARENYRKKLKRIQFDVYPTEQDIRERIEERVASGEAVATYIKRLVREDIKKGETT